MNTNARYSLPHPEQPAHTTLIDVVYPVSRGPIGLRGSLAPLSWTETMLPTCIHGDRHLFEVAIPEGATADVKLVRGADEWAAGRNFTLHAGDHLHLEPAFERDRGTLLEPVQLEDGGSKLTYQVLLPRSYDEQQRKRYPVLYAQDGQSLWTTSKDPFGVWDLDTTLDQLLDLSVIQELIVVAIDTSEARLERLSPAPDPEYGGGNGREHLRFIAEVLKPRIDRDFRTRPGPDDTGIMGSSMGGLFSFYAAWTRPDVFGKAICLSSSFWWANRHMIRAVSTPPALRPTFYLDSGAALSAEEINAGAHDGFHHTRAMHRALDRVGYTHGHDLHRLTFPGHSHQAASWAARVAIPLQLLFAPRPPEAIPARHSAMG